MLMAALASEQMHRMKSLCSRNLCQQHHYDIPTLHNLNLQSTTQMFTCRKLSAELMSVKIWNLPKISPGNLLEI